jgi:serine/threonine protein kinase
MGKKVGRYIIEEQLGEGSFAYVYRALDPELERHVALKVLKPAWLSDPAAVARFKQEARTIAKLDKNPHIAVVYEVGEDKGQVYLAQLLVAGETLAARLTRGPLAWSEALDILRPIASALDYAHNQGVIHRDIKPSNILLDEAGQPYLSDFGLVRAVEGSVSLSASVGDVKGTVAYIAPEVWNAEEPTLATDVYALSCVLFEMLTGTVLFAGSSMMAVMRKHDRGPQFPEKWPEGVPEGVTGVLQRGLAADPKERISSAGELSTALMNLSTLAQPEIPIEIDEEVPTKPWSKRDTVTLWLISADGQSYELKRGSLTLGRSSKCEIQIDALEVSRKHAVLEFDGLCCIVYDQGSANGTFVNKQRVGPGGQSINPGDRLTIGKASFTLSVSLRFPVTTLKAYRPE